MLHSCFLEPPAIAYKFVISFQQCYQSASILLYKAFLLMRGTVRVLLLSRLDVYQIKIN